MVKARTVEVKEGFEDFFEVLEEFELIQGGVKPGNIVKREGLDRVRDQVKGKVKLNLEGLKVMRKALGMNLYGEVVNEFDCFIEKIAKKVLDEVKKV